GDLAGAAASYRQAIKSDPGVADAHSNLGLALQATGAFEDAIACFERALTLRPNFADAMNNLGVTMHALGRFDEAAENYRRAIAAGADTADLHYNLANALKDLGQRQQAVEEYQAAIARAPGFAEAHHNLGNALRDLGNLAAAQVAFERVLELVSNDARALNGLGSVFRKRGRPRDAADYFRKAVAASPSNAEPLINLGTALQDFGDLTEAEKIYRQALALAPTSAEAHNNLGAVLRELGQAAAARDCYRRAVEIAPSFLDAHRNLISVQFSEFDPETCTALSEQSFWAQPKPPAGLAELIVDSILKAGNLEGAKRFVDKLASVGRPQGMVLRAEIACAEFAGDFVTAARLAAMPEAKVSGIVRAQHLLLSGDAEAAWEVLDRTERRGQEDIINAAAIGWHILKLLGRNDDFPALYDCERYVYRTALADFSSISDAPAFLDGLRRDLEGLHRYRDAPFDQSLRLGTQTIGNLFAKHQGTSSIAALSAEILQGVGNFLRDNDVRRHNPILRAVRETPAFTGSWSVRLRDQGFHVDHNHPEGLISGVFYVSVPECVSETDPGRQGWLKFGQPTPNPFGFEPDGWAMPVPGLMVLFPSYFWHGTVPFRSDAHRLSVAFDIV
ncbi:MAG: tetratricopeptide repeat protein, partial [Proteobacteria bacterium]|nr:tetratricopeptide repeat protein [Pseudomonadota bacterium]